MEAGLCFLRVCDEPAIEQMTLRFLFDDSSPQGSEGLEVLSEDFAMPARVIRRLIQHTLKSYQLELQKRGLV